MSPPIFVVLALAIFFGGLGSLLMIVASATDHWEQSTWSSAGLATLPNLNRSASVFDDINGFYKVGLKREDGQPEGTVVYLRNNYGGIWRICDTISDELRRSELYKEAAAKTKTLEYDCIYYITQYTNLTERALVDKTGEDIGRMQNSAASCIIVSIMCLLTAAVIGFIGIWQKQVSACMVTGVMYVVAAVFNCFGLIIIITKISYLRNDCYSIDPDVSTNDAICGMRLASVGYSVPIAWVSFAFFLLSSIFWCFISRCLRLEKTKSMI